MRSSRWATASTARRPPSSHLGDQTLREFIVKGFVLDDERLELNKRFGKDYFVAMSHGSGAGASADQLTSVLELLAPRWFLLRDLHRPEDVGLLQSRTTLSWLEGPMIRGDLRRLAGDASSAAPSPCVLGSNL